MLFRPYRAIYLGKRQLPFTPGLIPRNQERLAGRVAKTITESLLTPDEIQGVARRLLQPERVQAGILWLLQSSLAQIGRDKEQKTARIVANVLRDLVGESLPRLLKVLSRREDFLAAQIDRIFDRVLLEFRLSDTQARQLADWFVQVVVPPDTLRQVLVDVLTDRNIQVIDATFREKSSGTYWVVANLFGLRNTLTRLRTFCLDEKETANGRLEELILTLELRNRLRGWLGELSLQNLPAGTVRQLRETTRETVRQYVRERGADVVRGVGSSVNWDEVSVTLVRRLQSSTTVRASLETVSQELAWVLDRYLERDLGHLVSKALPILAIDDVIVNRVRDTSPEELEIAVQSIVKQELQGIVNLGGLLGFLVGLLQAALIYWF